MALGRIDVHTNVVPPTWDAAVKQAGRKPPPPVKTRILILVECGTKLISAFAALV